MAKDNNLVIIDADSIIYLVGYDLSSMLLEPLGILKLDEFIQDILVSTGSKEYLGYIAGKCGKNFRYDVATTKEYKGNRSKEKEEWYEFWDPILKKRMEEHWGFEPVCNMEADDACAVAANELRGKYNKITIASPDKDLFQIPDTWFYDYNKRTTVYCDKEVAMQKLCAQLITGDSSDNIPGCPGAGPSKAAEFLLEAATNKWDTSSLLDKVKDYYVNWHTVVLKEKTIKKQERDYLAQYKKDNGLTRFTKLLKDKALQSFVPDTSRILSEVEAKLQYVEQYTLVKLIDNAKDAKKYKFELTDPIEDTSVDWENIITFHEELDMMDEEVDFDFQDDL